jgi:hypothetical protein
MPAQSIARADSYRIPKQRVSVEIALCGGEPEVVSVFLHLRAASHAGPERPNELLMNDDPFLTVVAADGGVRFINKAAIAWMSVALDQTTNGSSDGRVTMDRCEPIDLTLDDGRIFMGEVSILLPPAKRRLQDFLNGSAQFIEVRSSRAVHFVNRDRIVMVKTAE